MSEQESTHKQELPEYKVKRIDGKFVVEFPLTLHMPVEFHETQDEKEAEVIACERFLFLPLKITLGGVPLEFTAPFPICEETEES